MRKLPVQFLIYNPSLLISNFFNKSNSVILLLPKAASITLKEVSICLFENMQIDFGVPELKYLSVIIHIVLSYYSCVLL